MLRHLLDLSLPLLLIGVIVWQVVRGELILGSRRHDAWPRIQVDRDRDRQIFWLGIALQSAVALVLVFLFGWLSFFR